MSKIGTAITMARENGMGSLADYAISRYVKRSARDGFMRGVSSKKRCPRIIACLTSYPARIAEIELTLKSLLMQVFKPDMLMLWLSEEQFPNGIEDVPENIRAYERYGLEVRFCPGDARSHKKYLFAMREFPDDIIVTFDDDIVYRDDVIRVLYKSYRKHPYAISAMRAHRIMFDDEGNILPYLSWIIECSDFVDEPRMDLFATTGGGTLFPPHLLPPEALDYDMAMKCCPYADDVWLKVMEAINDVPVVLTEVYQPLGFIPELSDGGLWPENKERGGNDVQLARTLEIYNEVKGAHETLVERMRRGGVS